jgi:2-polyprenyl-6-methoxyphenol hydroxylase-like FAD-dependent oxidoreductase
VERERFDALLRGAARESGAELWRPAIAVEVTAAADGDGAVVVVERDAARIAVGARWVLDGSGRSGLVGRRRRVSSGRAWRTVALAALAERAGGWGLPEESHTLVESASWGWGWSVPVDNERRYFTVMFNPAEASFSQAALASEYERRLGDLPVLGSLVSTGALIASPFACDASTYSTPEVVQGRVLVVGDAASFLDPLSSFGVKKAMASAWLAAVAVRSALKTPSVTDAALQLFAGREAEYVQAAAGPLGELSRDAAEGRAGFWGPRAALEGDERQADLVSALREDREVHSAFMALRARDPANLRRGLVRTVPAALIRDDLVVVEDHLLLPGIDTPTRYLRNVDLVLLAALVGDGTEMGRLCASYEARAAALPLPDLIGAIAVLVAKGVLVLP